MEWSGWRLVLLNVASVALMLVTGAALVVGGIWFILFIGDHAYSYGCTIC